MNDALQKEITGEALTVLIGGTERPLAYPMHAVILYKQQTGDSLFKIDISYDKAIGGSGGVKIVGPITAAW